MESKGGGQSGNQSQTRTWNARVIAVVVIVAILGVAAGFGLEATILAPPKIVMTDAAVSSSVSSCATRPYQWTFDWTFTLVNFGGANGVATVAFLVDGGTVDINQYTVPVGVPVTQSTAVRGPDHFDSLCLNDVPDLAIVAVVRA